MHGVQLIVSVLTIVMIFGFSPLNAQESLDEQIQRYTEQIRRNPDYAEAFFLRGTAYVHKGEYDRAIQNYDEAIRLNPDYTEAYLNRSLIDVNTQLKKLNIQQSLMQNLGVGISLLFMIGFMLGFLILRNLKKQKVAEPYHELTKFLKLDSQELEIKIKNFNSAYENLRDKVENCNNSIDNDRTEEIQKNIVELQIWKGVFSWAIGILILLVLALLGSAIK